MNPCPKNPPLRSPAYRKWLRSQPCMVTGRTPCDPHHVKLFGNGGMGIKPPDNDCVPLAHEVHMLLDSAGWSEWALFESYWYGFDRDQIRNRLRRIADEHWARWEGMR